MNNSTISLLGSGWLGLPLAARLAGQCRHLNVSTRSRNKLAAIAATGAHPFLLDITALKPDDDAFFDADVLLVAITSKDIGAFTSLVRKIAASRVRHVLFVSSSSVYRNLNRAVNEDEAAEDPDSPLWRIETLFRQGRGFDTTVVRLSGLVGPGRHPGRFFSKGKVVPQPDAPVNLIHLDDCIGLIITILAQQAWGDVFNGCADTHPTKRVFYTHAAALMGMPPPICAQTGSPAWKIVANDKIKQRLGYVPVYPDVMQMPFE